MPESDRPWRIAPDKLVIIGLDTPHKEGEHPLWDARIHLPLDEALILSFMAIGVRVPIDVVVRDGRAYVVDGRRRTMNAREAARRLLRLGEPPLTVPICSTPGERLSDEMASEISATLNELRLNDPFPVKARRARRMLDREHDPARVATAFGISPETLAGWMSVLDAAPEVTSGLQTGTINLKIATELSALPRERQAEALGELLKEPARPSAPRARAIAQSITKGAPRGAPLPRSAVKRVLEVPERFDAQFVRGVRFAMSQLPAEEVEEIMKLANRI